jgi:broad specificity phosphatase PhoE
VWRAPGPACQQRLLMLSSLCRSPEQITQRVDRLIGEIRDKWHRPVMDKKDKGEGGSGDVLIVAHGHILRAFAQRWVGKSLGDGVAFLLEAGGVGTLR